MSVKYTKDHEWIRIDDDTATVGITNYAQEQLGDVVFVELPDDGREFAAGDEAAVVESVKAASEIYAPVSGRITATNGALADNPALVNSAAESEGWFFKMELFDPGQLGDLMDEDAYKKLLSGLD